MAWWDFFDYVTNHKQSQRTHFVTRYIMGAHIPSHTIVTFSSEVHNAGQHIF